MSDSIIRSPVSYVVIGIFIFLIGENFRYNAKLPLSKIDHIAETHDFNNDNILSIPECQTLMRDYFDKGNDRILSKKEEVLLAKDFSDRLGKPNRANTNVSKNNFDDVAYGYSVKKTTGNKEADKVWRPKPFQYYISEDGTIQKLR